MTAARINRVQATDHWVLANNTQGLLFDRQSMRLHSIDVEHANVLGTILEHVREINGADQSLSEILAAFSNNDLPNPLAGLSPPDRPSIAKREATRTKARRYLNKLAINIANSCNLACSYCYANEGVYGTPQRTLLSSENAEHFVKRIAERYDYIEGVQFMGGEPSMNFAAIKQVAETFRHLVGVGKLLEEPRYTLVTNAVAFNQYFLDVCREFDVELTVSLDGPQSIHDLARINRNGNGSYTSVRRNVDKAYAKGLSIEFEPTFSRAHLINNVSLIDLCNWFKNEFDVSVLHAPPLLENRYEKKGLALSNEEKVREYCAVTEWGIDNLLERSRYLLHAFTARVLESLESGKRNSHTCPAGNSMLAVSTKGDISPCWMFTDEAAYDMGNVNDADILGAKSQKVLAVLDRNELHSHPECRSCMIQPVCFGCKGGDYHATASEAGKSSCDYMRAMVVTAMMRIYSRPHVPTEPNGYYLRPSFGEGEYIRLRPKLSQSIEQPKKAGCGGCGCAG